MPNNLISYDIQCPFYLSEKRLSISCEDSPHFFVKFSKKKWWLKHYCMENWKECKYAAGLIEAYDEDERGDDEALENKKSESLREELRIMSLRLGKARESIERKDRKIDELRKENESLKKVKDNNYAHRKRLFKELQETKKELERVSVEQFEQLMELNKIFTERLAYLMETKNKGELLQSDVDEWASKQEEEVAITGAWDEKTDSRKWLVVRIPKETEDGQLLGEETKTE